MFIKMLSIAISTTVQATDVKTLSVFQKKSSYFWDFKIYYFKLSSRDLEYIKDKNYCLYADTKLVIRMI